MRILIFILMFLIISALVIVNNHNIYLIDKEDAKKFSEEYSSWSERIFQNIKTITGQVIEMEWIPNTTKISQIEETENLSQENNSSEEDFFQEDEFFNSLDWEKTPAAS